MSQARTRSFLLAGVAAASFFVACEPAEVARPHVAPQTSRLGINEAGDTLYVALADHDEVRAVDAVTGETKQTVSVVGHPHRLSPAGERAPSGFEAGRQASRAALPRNPGRL